MKTLLRFFLSERYLSNNDIENDWYGELCLNKIEDNGYVVIPRIGDTVVLDYDCIPDYSTIYKDEAEKIEDFICGVIRDCRHFHVVDVEHMINLESNYVDVFLYPEDEDDEDTEDCDDKSEKQIQIEMIFKHGCLGSALNDKLIAQKSFKQGRSFAWQSFSHIFHILLSHPRHSPKPIIS